MIKLNPDDLMVSSFSPMPLAAIVGAPGPDTGGDTGTGDTGKYTCITFVEVCEYSRLPEYCPNDTIRYCLYDTRECIDTQ